MTAKRLFVDQPLKPGESLSLDNEAAHYVGRVLRARVGDALALFNGDGYEFSATITALAKRELTLIVLDASLPQTESGLRISLFQALSRNEKMDWVIQKAVELGVERIQPVITERSVMQLDAERVTTRLQHWRGVAIHAAQQCGRCRITEIDPPRKLDEVLAATDRQSLAIVATPQASRSLANVLREQQGKPQQLSLLIGAEGGFSEQEIDAACGAGFVACSAGPRVLRTETAAIALISIAQYALGDLA